jgi:hypothetical protein
VRDRLDVRVGSGAFSAVFNAHDVGAGIATLVNAGRQKRSQRGLGGFACHRIGNQQVNQLCGQYTYHNGELINASNFEVFVWWRILGGAGIGIASALSPMYIAEIRRGLGGFACHRIGNQQVNQLCGQYTYHNGELINRSCLWSQPLAPRLPVTLRFLSGGEFWAGQALGLPRGFTQRGLGGFACHRIGNQQVNQLCGQYTYHNGEPHN